MKRVSRVDLVSGFLLTLLLSIAASALSMAQVTISIYNDARMPERTLIQAQHEASRIFQNVSVDSVWIVCQPLKTSSRPAVCLCPLGRTHLVLRIVPWSAQLGDSIFGVAFLSEKGVGVFSDVFYPSVEKLHSDYDASLSRVLGHVMAHEIGHLLLGTNAHSALGIMKPHWQREELQRIGRGTLLFTQEQGRNMRARLLTMTTELNGERNPGREPSNDRTQTSSDRE